MEKETSNRIKLGLFVTAGLLFFIIAVYSVGSKKNLFGSTFYISAMFNNVNGLQPGNNVRYAGIDVGTVKSVAIINDSVVKVDMIIENRIRPFIKKDAVASIGTDGLMGNKIISISPGSASSAAVESGDMIATAKPLDTDAMLRTLKTTNENTAEITANLKDITGNVVKGKGIVWKLLVDTSLAGQFEDAIVNIHRTSSSAAGAAAELGKIIHNVEQGKGAAGMLLTDTALASQLKKSVSSLNELSARAADAGNELSAIMKKVNSGEGALGKLVNDTVMASDIGKSIKEVSQGAEGFKQNMEALKHTWPLKKYYRKQASKTK